MGRKQAADGKPKDGKKDMQSADGKPEDGS
jgi:hypothetical protein